MTFTIEQMRAIYRIMDEYNLKLYAYRGGGEAAENPREVEVVQLVGEPREVLVCSHELSQAQGQYTEVDGGLFWVLGNGVMQFVP